MVIRQYDGAKKRLAIGTAVRAAIMVSFLGSVCLGSGLRNTSSSRNAESIQQLSPKPRAGSAAVTEHQQVLRIPRKPPGPPLVGSGLLQMGFQSEYNVLSYGAVGDGATDDTAAFESAIQAAVASGRGGIVYVPLGIYKIGNLVLPSTATWITILMDGDLYLTQTLNINHGLYALIGRWGSLSLQHQQFPATPIYYASSLSPVIRISQGPAYIEGISLLNLLGDGIVATDGTYELNITRIVVASALNGTGVPLRVESSSYSFGLNISESTFQGPNTATAQSIVLKNYGDVSIEHSVLMSGGIFVTAPNSPEDVGMDLEHILYENGHNALLNIDNSNGWVSGIELKFCTLADPRYNNTSLVYNSGSGLTQNLSLQYNYVPGTLVGGVPIRGVTADVPYADPRYYQLYLGQPDNYLLFEGGNTNPASLMIGTGGTPITKHLSASPAMDFATVPAGGQQEVAFTIAGAEPSDACTVSPDSAVEPNLSWNCYVASTDTVEVRLVNASSQAVTPSSHTWTIDLWQH